MKPVSYFGLVWALASPASAFPFPRLRHLQEEEPVCGALVGCALADITNWAVVASLQAEPVTYTIDPEVEYSIACYVSNGIVDQIQIAYGNGESHTELSAPYWVGGEVAGVPIAITYLATPGEKQFDVVGLLGGQLCFDHLQTLVAITGIPTVSPSEATTASPTDAPTKRATEDPAAHPTLVPTKAPSTSPTNTPTKLLTANPTGAPTEGPTARPTFAPTKGPTAIPTASPTNAPQTGSAHITCRWGENDGNLGVIDDSEYAGLQVTADDGSLDQEWDLVLEKDGFYIIRNRRSGKVLSRGADLDGDTWTPNEEVVIADLRSHWTGQRWSLECLDDSWCRLKNNGGSNGYLNRLGLNTGGTWVPISGVRLYPLNNSWHSQQWHIPTSKSPTASPPSVPITPPTKVPTTVTANDASESTTHITCRWGEKDGDLGVKGVNEYAGLQVTENTGSSDQEWELTLEKDGFYIIRNRWSGKVLSRGADWDGSKWTPNEEVVVADLRSHWSGQRWSLECVGDNWCRLKNNGGSHGYLNRLGLNTGGTWIPSGGVSLYPLNNAWHSQQWRIPTSTATPPIIPHVAVKSVTHVSCRWGEKDGDLGVKGVNEYAGLQVTENAGSSDQEWELTLENDGFYIIRNRWSGKVLSRGADWDGSKWTPNNEVVVADLRSHWSGQRWSLECTDDSWCRLKNNGGSNGYLNRLGLNTGGTWVPVSGVRLYPLNTAWHSQQWRVDLPTTR